MKKSIRNRSIEEKMDTSNEIAKKLTTDNKCYQENAVLHAMKNMFEKQIDRKIATDNYKPKKGQDPRFQ